MGLSESEPSSYVFDEFRVDARRRRLLQHGELVPLTPKAFGVLLELVVQHGRTVPKDALISAVWGSRAVEENNLNQAIAAVRRALAEPRGAHRYIVTLPGDGYRFVGRVKLEQESQLVDESRVVVAVLPFQSLSSDAVHDYLGEGLAEDTIAALGHINPASIAVVSRSSVAQYRHEPERIARLARDLGVQFVVDGSLRAEGTRLRVNAKLIRANDQLDVWAAAFDSEPQSLLTFQRELAAELARAIHAQIAPQRLAGLERRHTPNHEAFNRYWRGRYLWHQSTPATTQRALACYREAVDLDPGYALAWSGIADALSNGPITGDAPTLGVLPAAREAVDQALRAQPDLAEVQASLGYCKFWLEWDWDAAEAAFRRAAELDPGYPFPQRMIGLLCMHESRVTESIPAMQRARAAEPMLPIHHALSAQVAYAARAYRSAERFARQSLVIDPQFWIGQFHLGQALAALGQFDEADAVLVEAGRSPGCNSKIIALRGYILARTGRESEARQALSMLTAVALERYMPACAPALIHLGLGELDHAIACLERALAERDVHLMFLPIDAKWDEAMRDPRVKQIVDACAFRRDSVVADVARG